LIKIKVSTDGSDPLFDLCDHYPAKMLFVPSQRLMEQLIVKATQLLSPDQIKYRLNPQERQRLHNENDYREPLCPQLCELRVRNIIHN